MHIYLPYKINFLIYKNTIKRKNYLLIYSQNNYLFICLPNIQYNYYSNFINFEKNTQPQNTLNIISKYIYNYNNLYIKKIQFKGKGYKITKKKKFLILTFNHSHLIWMLLFNTLCVKVSKYKYLLILKNYLYLKNFVQSIINIRLVSIYTKRGIKLAKQKVFKKIGKRT